MIVKLKFLLIFLFVINVNGLSQNQEFDSVYNSLNDKYHLDIPDVNIINNYYNDLKGDVLSGKLRSDHLVFKDLSLMHVACIKKDYAFIDVVFNSPNFNSLRFSIHDDDNLDIYMLLGEFNFLSIIKENINSIDLKHRSSNGYDIVYYLKSIMDIEVLLFLESKDFDFSNDMIENYILAGNIDIIRYLSLKNRLLKNIDNFIFALSSGEIEIIDLFSEVNLNLSNYKLFNQEPLIISIVKFLENIDYEKLCFIFKILENKDVNLGEIDQYGNNALFYCYNDLNKFRALLDYGIDKDLVNNNNESIYDFVEKEMNLLINVQGNIYTYQDNFKYFIGIQKLAMLERLDLIQLIYNKNPRLFFESFGILFGFS